MMVQEWRATMQEVEMSDVVALRQISSGTVSSQAHGRAAVLYDSSTGAHLHPRPVARDDARWVSSQAIRAVRLAGCSSNCLFVRMSNNVGGAPLRRVGLKFHSALRVLSGRAFQTDASIDR
jgi:hypothetical protein